MSFSPLFTTENWVSGDPPFGSPNIHDQSGKVHLAPGYQGHQGNPLNGAPAILVGVVRSPCFGGASWPSKIRGRFLAPGMCQKTFFGRVEPLKGRKHPAIPHTVTKSTNKNSRHSWAASLAQLENRFSMIMKQPTETPLPSGGIQYVRHLVSSNCFVTVPIIRKKAQGFRRGSD